MKRIIITLALFLVTMQTFGQGTTKYEYDALNCLTKVTYSNGTVVEYTYDVLGNRLSKKVTGGGVDFIRGDANGEGTVDVCDMVAIMDYILNKPSDTFNFNAADVNGDGAVNVADIVGIVNIILGNKTAARQMKPEIEAIMGTWVNSESLSPPTAE